MKVILPVVGQFGCHIDEAGSPDLAQGVEGHSLVLALVGVKDLHDLQDVLIAFVVYNPDVLRVRQLARPFHPCDCWVERMRELIKFTNLITDWSTRISEYSSLIYMCTVCIVFKYIYCYYCHASVPYPKMHHSEHKWAHFCSEWCIVVYETNADLWDWSLRIPEY